LGEWPETARFRQYRSVAGAVLPVKSVQAMKLRGNMEATRLFHRVSEAFPGRSQRGEPIFVVVGAREAKI
jgi:hypothetical protein